VEPHAVVVVAAHGGGGVRGSVGSEGVEVFSWEPPWEGPENRAELPMRSSKTREVHRGGL